ncbi:Conserved_hypothetical protein [Hexamita inflata]|uniref:Uncharacterized protein n=1 Tax=Hexamita inflata TaxID=28002 RepID=A0AA86P8H4_9EUKA|nr:Conserved hypothetical protein [Hexamita inflata]
MIAVIITTQYQAFSISEFSFCYNYVYDSPFQESLSLNLSTTFSFDVTTRSSCTETQNVIFRQVSNPVVNLQLQLDVDTQQTSFAIFFYIFKNVEIQNTVINLNLKNGSNQNASLLVHTQPEFTISVFSTVYNIKTDSSNFNNVYGISRVLDQKLSLNQSQFTFTLSSGVNNFFGLCYQAEQVSIENCTFNLNVNATIATGLLYVSAGSISIYNISMNGQLLGSRTYGIIYQAKAQVSMNQIQYTIQTNGSTQNCGFIQITTDSAAVSAMNINFVGFSFYPSEPTNYGPGLTCPCIPGANLVNGLCNCSQGSQLTDGVCLCTPGSTLSENICKCTIGATMDISGKCVCTQGATLQSGVCVCTPGATLIQGLCVCTTNAILSGELCVCQPTNSALSGGICVCKPLYSTMQGNKCICTPDYSSMDNGVCKCTPTDSFMTNGVCQCPVNSQISSTQCICLPQYSAMKSGQCTCSPQYSLMDGNNCKCTPSYSTMQNGICTCPAGSSFSNGVCICTAYGSIMSNGVCVCPAGASLQGNTCVCTVTGSELQNNDNIFQCVCVKDYASAFLIWNGGNYWCHDRKMCCSTRDAGPSYRCSDKDIYWDGCKQYTNQITD